jgi:hypothetical protein
MSLDGAIAPLRRALKRYHAVLSRRNDLNLRPLYREMIRLERTS